MSDTPNVDTDYERSDVTVKLVALLAGGMAASVAAVLVALRIGFPQAVDDRRKGPIGPPPPQPRLQESPPADMAAFRRMEQERLSSYGWVDRSAGVIRIPIENAMRLVARRRLKQWSGPQP